MMSPSGFTTLADYRPYPFRIPFLDMDVRIFDKEVSITSIMKIDPEFSDGRDLILEGKNLDLQEVNIISPKSTPVDYKLHNNKLIISDTPDDVFLLKIHNKINPYKNFSLEGLYASGNILSTQCEAEGFRRICFHPDRPDVLSKYRVRIEAERGKYPVLLSNGNRVSASILPEDDSRHEVVWQDPHPKPSYLFALVAGDLVKVSDTFRKQDKRKIAINLYVEKENQLYTQHAISSLKKAMEWDKNVYNLDYDLDEYNIVAVRHFNMGAMENKGLNIFNSKLVLADSKIATDDELIRIESVIAHEYFHNWTGNRITCRDWFQLSLKEGLTVFRDQSFTGYLHGQDKKRIEDVSFLRNTQFKEDSGPTSHPVKPSQYKSIDNFYTTTIYEKGAELIRMLQIVLGNEAFMKGIGVYIRKFDGSAATTENFIEAVWEGAKNSNPSLNLNLDQFYNWYYKEGTPFVTITRHWDSVKGKLTIGVEQALISPNKTTKSTFLIPISVAVISKQGRSSNNKLFILDKTKKDFEIDSLEATNDPPILSLFRGFSAPVNWKSDLTCDELLHLFQFDDDSFSRWDAGQQIMRKIILDRASKRSNDKLEKSLFKSFKFLIQSKSFSANKDLLPILMTFPGLPELELFQNPSDPISLFDSIYELQSSLGKSLASDLREWIGMNKLKSTFTWPEGQTERRIIGLAWRWLILGGDSLSRRDARSAVKGNSMTLARSGLHALQFVDCEERNLAMAEFFDRWKDKPEILDTWFSLEASMPRKNGLAKIEELLSHPLYDPMAPNAVRAVLGGLVMNTRVFHASDGSGYDFLASQVWDLDKRNPITASRLVKVFTRWRSYLKSNREAMLKSLCKLSAKNLSNNTREVVDLILEGQPK